MSCFVASYFSFVGFCHIGFWIWDLRVNDFVELIGFGGYLVFKMLSELVPSVLYIGHFEPDHQEQERKIK